VPQVIYTIPPCSPVYNVTYVTQYATPTGSVQASYTAGYLGIFIAGAAIGAIIAQGNGYYYPPYVVVGRGPYPVYYPRPAPYGYRTYNPYTGATGVRGVAYGPNGSAHWGTSYNPYTGTYARGASVSGRYGSASVGQAYNPYTGAYGATRQGSNAYGQWGSSVVTKGNQWAATQHSTTAAGSVGTYRNSAGGKAVAGSNANGRAVVGKTAGGDMYAGRDGNVYKNTLGCPFNRSQIVSTAGSAEGARDWEDVRVSVVAWAAWPWDFSCASGPGSARGHGRRRAPGPCKTAAHGCVNVGG
jgi:hypothetical protein